MIVPNTLSKLYPDWTYMEYYKSDEKYAQHSTSGCVVNIKEKTSVGQTTCSNDEINTAGDIELAVSALFSSKDLNSSQVFSGIMYYFNNR